MITQSLYLVVFCCRYLPYPLTLGLTGLHLWWNLTLKLFYILSSVYILILMLVYARTREREAAWKLGGAVFVGSLIMSPFVMMIFRSRADERWSVAENSWIFSTVLEAVAVLPQLQLLRQTSVPTVIDSFYLVALALYRFFYILNWIVQGVQPDKSVDPVAVIFGVIQTLIFLDFFWVYWSRQRVKLRGGNVIDSDDLRNGWLVKRLLGRQVLNEIDNDEEEGVTSGRWGARGISVSADAGLHQDGTAEGDDREALAAPEAFEDDIEEAEDGTNVEEQSAAVGDGSEWRDDNKP